MQSLTPLADYSRVGKFLVREGKISNRQLKQALAEQARRREKGVDVLIGAVCVDLGFCTTEDVDHAIECRKRAMLERPASTAKALDAFRKATDSVRLTAKDIAAHA